MAKVDRDLDAILQFCTEFRIGFLEPTGSEADNIISIANEINSTLGGTRFASKSQDEVLKMGKAIKNAVDTGEERIRELERKVRDQIQRGREFTR